MKVSVYFMASVLWIYISVMALALINFESFTLTILAYCVTISIVYYVSSVMAIGAYKRKISKEPIRKGKSTYGRN